MKENNSVNDNYATLKIPKDLAEEIDRIIESGTLGYRSRAELAIEAIRRRVEEILSNNSFKHQAGKET